MSKNGRCVVTIIGIRVVILEMVDDWLGLFGNVVNPMDDPDLSISFSLIHFELRGSTVQSTLCISSASQIASAHVPRQIFIINGNESLLEM